MGGPQAATQPAMASTTRAAARRQAAEQRQAAAWPLPLELLPLVVAHLARETWPAARLSCKQLEAALAPHVRSLSLARWPGPGGRGRQLQLRPGLACVATLEVPDPAGDAEWHVLQQLSAQLPVLRHLHFIRRGFTHSFSLPAPVAASWASSSLTWLELPRSVQHVLPAVALPGLRVARLGSRVSAGAVAAFAPRLQQLSCYALQLQAAEAPGAVLEALSHLHAACVEVTGAGSVADGMAALRRALPALAVLVCEPAVRDLSYSWRASLDDVLAALPGVTAVCGASQVAGHLARVRASSLGRLQHLALCNDACDAPQQLLAAAPHLQRLASLTLVCAPSDRVAPLLRALAALPALASLVLPMRALCKVCCPGVHAALPALVGSTSLVSLEFVVVLPGQYVPASMQSCEHAGSCTAGASVVRAAAAQRGAPLQRLSLQREVRLSWWAELDFMCQAARGDGGVWGAFGPVEGGV